MGPQPHSPTTSSTTDASTTPCRTPLSVEHADSGDEHLVILTGDVGLGHVRQLRAALDEGLGADGHDVLLDTRAVTSFADAALTALSTARSWAKQHHHRIIVIDSPEGPVATSLRRTGLWECFPVHPDLVTASTALAAARTTRAAMDTPYEAHWRRARTARL